MNTAELFEQISTACDRVSLYLGTTLSWLSLAMVLSTSAVVLIRLGLDKGSLAAQETVVYAHASLFMLCLAFNLQQNAHVRVDVFYHRFSPYTQAWINTLGAILLLLPFAFFLVFISLDFVTRAWQIKESSSNPGGLPLIYLLKSLIPMAGALLVLQGFSQACRGLSIIYSSNRSESG